ncbi:MAG: Gfo/Idh/MocA family oxidoreductase [Chitinophagaceae bacterium]|nr:Gfo/Idh/MocA family oxidoreductase [Chitinophagaceae bacterium]
MFRIGIIGSGMSCTAYSQAFLPELPLSLSGFFDARTDVAATYESQHSIPRFNSITDLFHQVDGVIITAQSDRIYEYAQSAIREGKHVMIEKRLPANLEQAKELVEMSKESGVRCLMGNRERAHPVFDQLRKRCSSPLFIEAYRVLSYDGNPQSTDVINELMLHDIDLVLCLVKSELKRVSASGTRVVSEGIDIASARLEFSNGCVANLTASRIATEEKNKFTVFQKDRYFQARLNQFELSEVSLDQSETQGHNSPFRLTNESFKPSISAIMELVEFKEVMQEQKNPTVSFEDAYLAVVVADRIIKKINSLMEE